MLSVFCLGKKEGVAMHYYGTRLSENISRREPEGYLLCLNVAVARSGTQEYLPEELGITRGLSDRPLDPFGHHEEKGLNLIQVYRPEEEVFSPETMASFEGMPVTNDHPPDGVDVSNIRALQKGHAHNVRRGTGEESDLLLADLIITDPQLIHLIMEEGKREISCGYTYELHEENGQYIQRKIRGNHVAVVDAGRAGPRVRINDYKPERSNKHMKKSLVKKLVRMAKDGDPEAIEAVAELLEEVAEGEILEPAEAAVEETAEAVAEVAEDPAAVVETPEATIVIDEATLGEVLSRLDQIIALLTPAASDEDPVDPVEEIAEAVEEAVEAAIAGNEVLEDDENEDLPVGSSPEDISAMMEEIMEPVLFEALEPEEAAGDECEDPEQNPVATDALRAALTAIRPALARMPRKQRRKVAADIAAKLRRTSGRRAADGKTYAALVTPDLGKRIMAKRSANRHH